MEARNFDIRKQLLEYDDVSNDQRKVIYQQRNELLEATDISETIAAMRQGVFSDLVRVYVPAESIEEQWDLPVLGQVLRDEWQIETQLEQMVEESDNIDDEDILAVVLDAFWPRRDHHRLADAVAGALPGPGRAHLSCRAPSSGRATRR